jgi:hypothetical protein
MFMTIFIVVNVIFTSAKVSDHFVLPVIGLELFVYIDIILCSMIILTVCRKSSELKHGLAYASTNSRKNNQIF